MINRCVNEKFKLESQHHQCIDSWLSSIPTGIIWSLLISEASSNSLSPFKSVSKLCFFPPQSLHTLLVFPVCNIVLLTALFNSYSLFDCKKKKITSLNPQTGLNHSVYHSIQLLLPTPFLPCSTHFSYYLFIFCFPHYIINSMKTWSLQVAQRTLNKA